MSLYAFYHGIRHDFGIRLLVPVLIASGCGRPPPPPPAPQPPPRLGVQAPDTVWTSAAGVILRRDDVEIPIVRAFTRLEVLGADSVSLLVRCGVCPDTVRGWVARAAVLHEATTPHAASRDSLAAFAAAVRHAARSHDLVELRLVMALDFSFSAIGAYGRDLALSAWVSEEFRSLDLVPSLLDRGLTPLGDWWVAPPEFESRLDYRGRRLGFRRTPDGRWEWVFLMRGEVE